MTAYRRCWAVVWTALAAVPVLLGLLAVEPVALACTGILAATVVAGLGWRSASAWVPAGLLGVAVAAGVGWAHGAGVGMVLLAAASSPYAVGRLVERAGRRRSAAPVATDLVRSLGDDRLCAAWSESFVALRLARTPDERLHLVNLRQAYLDEIEARDADGFRTWLETARPVGNPRPFIDPH